MKEFFTKHPEFKRAAIGGALLFRSGVPADPCDELI